jgi:hypothetical protein
MNASSAVVTAPPICDEIPPGTLAFYRRVLQALDEGGVPFLVGGAYAFNIYTSIARRTKDLDIFLRRSDVERAATCLESHGCRCEMAFPHWLAKAYDCTAGEKDDGDFVDIIFSSGNAVAEVDDLWFEHAVTEDVFGMPARLCPIEEMIWSKAFVMERERFDGADIAHLVLACSERIDWQRLLARFGPHWRVLLSHLVLFGYSYPGQRDRVPAWVLDSLLERLHAERAEPVSHDKLCAGTLLSREQYLMDVEHWGYRDARLAPDGNMSLEDAARWTDAIPSRKQTP